MAIATPKLTEIDPRRSNSVAMAERLIPSQGKPGRLADQTQVHEAGGRGPEAASGGHVYAYDSSQGNSRAVSACQRGSYLLLDRSRHGRPERVGLGRFPDLWVGRVPARPRRGSLATGQGASTRSRNGEGGDRRGRSNIGSPMPNLEKKVGLPIKPISTTTSDRSANGPSPSWGTMRLPGGFRALANAGPDHRQPLSSPAVNDLRQGSRTRVRRADPCTKVERFRERSRERFLLPDEMRPFMLALKAEPPEWRDFWLLCLFTGARRGNVAGMAWSDVDTTQGIWYLAGEQLKNGLPLAVVLPPPAAALLQAR